MKHRDPEAYRYFGDLYIHRPYVKPERDPTVKLPTYVCSEKKYISVTLEYHTSIFKFVYSIFDICSPGFKYWKAVTNQMLYIRYKCMAIDICDHCTIFENHIQDAMDAGEQKKAERLQS